MDEDERDALFIELSPEVEAVVTEDGKIIFTGSKKKALKLKNPQTRIRNLEGNTLIPGFIDAHSHFLVSSLMDAITVNLSPPPVGDITSIESIIETLKKEIRSRKLKPGKVILGKGYDES